jgi:hypothetical protein
MESFNYAGNPTVDIMCDGIRGLYYITKITIPKDKLYSGRILLSDLLDLIGDELKLYEKDKHKPLFLIVACRTVDGDKKKATNKPSTFNFSERNTTPENSYILIEGHGTEPELKAELTYTKADVRFRAPIGFQCRKKPIPEEYDAFMACVASVEKYPIPSTNNLIDIKEMRITLRYMTDKKDYLALERHGTFQPCYKKFMKGVVSGLKRNYPLSGEPNTSGRSRQRIETVNRFSKGGSIRRRRQRKKTRRR